MTPRLIPATVVEPPLSPEEQAYRRGQVDIIRMILDRHHNVRGYALIKTMRAKYPEAVAAAERSGK